MLIDADALRQAILSMMPERSEILLIVDNQPDAIVRCKDCKYGYPLTDSAYIQCAKVFHTSERHENTWYCADGERKDGDGN